MASDWMPLKIKKYIVLVSAFFVHLVFGSFYTSGAFIPYLASYLYYNGDETITTAKISFIQLLQLLMISVGMIVSSIFASNINNRIVVIVATFGFIVSVFISSFFTTLWGFLIFYGVFYGFMIGIGYMAPLKNCYKFFPDRKGLCAGICMMGFGLSAVIFNQILQKLINPDNQKTDQHHRFPKDVADNVQFALRIMCLVYILFALVGISLFFTSVNQNNKSGKEQPVLQTHEVKQNTANNLKNWKFYYEKKIHWVMLSITLTSIYGMFLALNYKQYGQNVIQDDSFLTLIGSLGSLSNGFSRFFWGALFDKVSFKTIMLSLNIVSLICCIGVIFARQVQVLYLLIVIISYFCYGGTYSIFPTQTIRILGQIPGAKFYPYVFLAFAVSALLQFTFHITLVEAYGDDGFLYILILLAVFQVGGLIVGQIINYKYNDVQNTLFLQQQDKNQIPQQKQTLKQQIS